MDLVKDLNEMQKQAVLKTEGPLLLLAGAGSGKTKALTHRIAYLLDIGINPFNIIAITFTNKAAKEMKERTEKLHKSGGEVWISTFHSACVRILRRDIHHIDYRSSFTIYDDDDSEKLMKQVIKDLNINDKQFPVRAMMNEISSLKDELITPAKFEKLVENDFRKKNVAAIYKQYQKRLKDSNALDFNDIIFKTVELFSKNPEVLEKYQGRFHYVMVDEYQDTNTSQYTFVRMLSDKHKNICVVGDDDQSIYGWRGANIRNILDFEKDFSNACSIKLEQNYRSTKTILNAANEVIKNNKGRKNKTLWTENNNGDKINVFRAATDLDESAFITRTIKEKSDRAYADFAILYRTNAQSRSIEDSLVKNNIPYRIFGGVKFYDRREIKDIMAYLRIIVNPFDDLSIRRIINVPRRGIGDTTIDSIAYHAKDNAITFYNACRNCEGYLDKPKSQKIVKFLSMLEDLEKDAEQLCVSDLIKSILAKTDYVAEIILKKEDDENAEDRINNIHEFITKAEEFEKMSEAPSLTAFLEEVSLVADIDNLTDENNSVVLMTLHSSKGLEFPVVFIAGFEEGIFPSYRSLQSGDSTDKEEERRLCYVGITRAKEELYITMANERRQHGQKVSNAPSSFLREIPIEFLKDVGLRTIKTQAELSPLKVGKRTVAIENNLEGFGAKNYASKEFPAPKDIVLDYQIGDTVRQIKYGGGRVVDIKAAGADYEVTVDFDTVGIKKMFAHLSKLVKI